MVLPDGMRMRPTAPGDEQAITDVVAADELQDLGHAEIELDDVRGVFASPSFDPATDGVVVELEGTPIGAAMIWKRRADVDVHPRWHGLGVGSALRTWTEQRAREKGLDAIGQTLSATNAAAREQLARAGYEQTYEAWLLRIELGGTVADVGALPDGLTIRQAHEADERAMYELVERSFAHWPGRDPVSYEDWRALTVDRPSARPSYRLVAVAAPDGAVVGALVGFDAADEGWIQQVAVDERQRGRGIGGALLRAAFSRFAADGKRTAGLGTDSRTGALALYERVGMHVASTHVHYRLPLR